MFCRGDVMSRFVILEALERSGTGASKGFPFDSFPDPAQIPGHSMTTPPCQTKLPAPLLLGPGIVRLGRLNCSNYLSTCLSDHEKIPPKKGTPSASGKRQASALPREGIPPCPHYLTIAILIPFRYFRFKSLGNINHNSRTEPHTNHAERSLTLPNAPAERPTGCPISFSELHPGVGCTGTKFPAADQRGESLRGNGVLLGAFHSRAGLEPADKRESWGELGAAAQCDTERSNKG